MACALLIACDADRGPGAVSASAARGREPAAIEARFVKLEELTEWNGNAWASVAEFNLMDATGADVDRSAWVASADSAGASEVAQRAIDGDPHSWWHTRWEGTEAAPAPPHWLAFDLGRTVRLSGFRYLPRQDRMVNGTIAKYRFYVSGDGVNWGEPVSTGNFFDMSAPTTEKAVLFAPVSPNHAPELQAITARSTPMGRAVTLSVRAGDADGDALAYTANGLPPGLAISPVNGVVSGTPIVPGTYAVEVSVSDAKAAPVRTHFQWNVEAPLADDAVRAERGEVRFVKLEEVTEVGGRAWGSIAEFNLVDAHGANLPREGWTASADSTDGLDAAAHAIDADPRSIWHSAWEGASPPPPHSFIVDLGHAAVVTGFRYLPRQDRVDNGTFAKFRFYASTDGVHWGQPLVEGDFTSMGDARAEKTVALK